jgi:ornithine cyclodeaminase
MKVLILNHSDIEALLPMSSCIDVMAEALAALTRGDAILPLRNVLRLPDGTSAFAVMPAYLGHANAVGAKVITVFPDNHGTAFDSHQGAVLLFEGDRGSLAAIMDASSITAIRTAAVSGLATRLLAREEARELAILGTGVQARTHLDAVCAVRPIARVRVWSRNADAVRAFAERESRRLGVAVEAGRSAREAVEGADVVVTDTWISMGQEHERARRLHDLAPYQLDEALLALASRDAFVMHCLPAHPGEEITADVLYGERSAAWDQAENRLHAQKALLELLLSGP